MIFPPGLRKLALSVHLTLSVGWIGANAAYVALDITAATTQDAVALRAAYLGMGSVAGSAIVPLSISSLLTGLVMSVGTKWGLFRHWWVVISLLLTATAALVLMVEMQTIHGFAAMAADPTTSSEDLRSMGNTLIHSVGGTAVLLVVLVLNVYKPSGLTPYGWRKQLEARTLRQAPQSQEGVPAELSSDP